MTFITGIIIGLFIGAWVGGAGNVFVQGLCQLKKRHWRGTFRVPKPPMTAFTFTLNVSLIGRNI